MSLIYLCAVVQPQTISRAFRSRASARFWFYSYLELVVLLRKLFLLSRLYSYISVSTERAPAVCQHSVLINAALFYTFHFRVVRLWNLSPQTLVIARIPFPSYALSPCDLRFIHSLAHQMIPIRAHTPIISFLYCIPSSHFFCSLLFSFVNEDFTSDNCYWVANLEVCSITSSWNTWNKAVAAISRHRRRNGVKAFARLSSWRHSRPLFSLDMCPLHRLIRACHWRTKCLWSDLRSAKWSVPREKEYLRTRGPSSLLFQRKRCALKQSFICLLPFPAKPFCLLHANCSEFTSALPVFLISTCLFCRF